MWEGHIYKAKGLSNAMAQMPSLHMAKCRNTMTWSHIACRLYRSGTKTMDRVQEPTTHEAYQPTVSLFRRVSVTRRYPISAACREQV